jgi:hypothetical protein
VDDLFGAIMLRFTSPELTTRLDRLLQCNDGEADPLDDGEA